MKISGQTLDAGQVVFGTIRWTTATGGAGIQIGERDRHSRDRSKKAEGGRVVRTGRRVGKSQPDGNDGWRGRCSSSFRLLGSFREVFRHDRPAIRVDAMEKLRARTHGPPASDQKTKFLRRPPRLDDRFSEPNYELGHMLFRKEGLSWRRRVAGARDSRRFALHGKRRSNWASAAITKGDYDAAIRLFRHGQRRSAAQRSIQQSGLPPFSRRNDASAAAGFMKALEGDEGDPDYWFNYGYALWNWGNTTKPPISSRAALQRSPDDTGSDQFSGALPPQRSLQSRRSENR